MIASKFKSPIATEGEIRWYNGNQVRFLINPEDTEGDLSLVEMTSLAGTEPPAHIHQNEDETFVIHEGEIRFFIGEKVMDAKPGMTVFAPRGIRHAFKIMTPAARFHMIMTPGDFANFFREMSTETPQAGLIAPPTPEQFRAITQHLERRYGVYFPQNSL
ncbi:MAG: cupin domain-containing protein [Saprospiraceae bacterium]